MRPMYYDRDGHPIGLDEWGAKMEDRDYRVLKQESIGRYGISTIWMGLDHNIFRPGAPLIFETMIFCDDEIDELYQYQKRYVTEKDAFEGHEDAVKLCFETLKRERDFNG